MKLRIKNTIYIGFAFLSIMILWQGYNWFVPIFLNNKLEILFTEMLGNSGLASFVVGAIMGLDNLVALFMIPLVSKMSDKTKSPLGKRIPFIIVGLSIATLAFASVPLFAYGNLIVLVLVLMVIMISMNIYRSPAVALMPDITPKPLRARANAIINLMGGIGTGMGYLICYICSERFFNTVDTVPILIISGVMFVCLAIIITTVREKKFKMQMLMDVKDYCNKTGRQIKEFTDIGEDESEELTKVKSSRADKRNLLWMLIAILFYYMATNAIETFMSLYSKEVLGSEAYGLELLAALAIGNFGFLIPAAILAEKFGRKIIMLIGSGLMFISVGIMSFVQSFSYFLLVPFFLSGIGMAIMITNMYPAIISFCGKSEYAKFTGYYYTSTMLAQAITPALAGLFMSAYFNGSYHRLMPYAAIFTLLCFIALLFVDKNEKAKKKEGDKDGR